LVGSGGNIFALALLLTAQSPERAAEATAIRVELDAVQGAVNWLWSLSLEERLRLRGLPRKRANTILTGAAFCEAFMDRFGFPEFTATVRGLRHGAILETRGRRAEAVLACHEQRTTKSAIGELKSA
jgi:exopolyphosphatase/pppGpp-phosphohydrolase